MRALHGTGIQHQLVAGEVFASVTEVGGGLRDLVVGNRSLVCAFPLRSPRPLYRGSVLVPWPNRVSAGRYDFAGRSQQLALTEPDRGNALHGLACWSPWHVLDRTSSTVMLGVRLWPQQGWPHLIDVVVAYELTPAGLRWTVQGHNMGTEPAPWGSSVHPYLMAGPGRVDDWELELQAAQVMTVDPDTLRPTGLIDVDGSGFDFRTRRSLQRSKIDHAFTGLPDSDKVSARLWAESGTGVAMHWSSRQLPWVQVHTADRPEPADDRTGLAIEPMTCPPDAFNSGTDLVILQPGASHSAQWEIEALGE